MRFALLTGDETPEDLRELIGNLRDRQRRTQIQSVRDELDRDVNEAFDLIKAIETRDAVGSQPTA